jgi:hypothetical protein
MPNNTFHHGSSVDALSSMERPMRLRPLASSPLLRAAALTITLAQRCTCIFRKNEAISVSFAFTLFGRDLGPQWSADIVISGCITCASSDQASVVLAHIAWKLKRLLTLSLCHRNMTPHYRPSPASTVSMARFIQAHIHMRHHTGVSTGSPCQGVALSRVHEQI